MRGHIASQLVGIALGVPGLVVEGLGFKNTRMYLYCKYKLMHTKKRYIKGLKGILLASPMIIPWGGFENTEGIFIGPPTMFFEHMG